MPNSPKRAVAISRIAFCEDSHHSGGAEGVSWLKAHAAVVGAGGAGSCFGCHSPVACAKCHVRHGR